MAIRILPLVAVAALSAGNAFGQETLNFSAVIQSDVNPWLQNECPTCGINTAAVGTDITGTVVLSSALPANGTTTIAAVGPSLLPAPAIVATSIMFSAPNNASVNLPMINGVPLAGSYSFTFTTVNNAITAFSFDTGFFTPDGGGAYVEGSNTGTVAQSSAGANMQEMGTSNYTVEASGGSWIDPPSGGALAAPEIDATGTAAGLTLLAGLLLMGRGRRS